MLDKGRALKPQEGSDKWQTNENSSRRGLKPDIKRTQGILHQYKGKENAAGLKPQRWPLKPRRSSIRPMEAKGDQFTMKAPLGMKPKGVSNKRPVSSDTSRALKAPIYRVASIPDPSTERKTAVELVPLMKWPKDVSNPQQRHLQPKSSWRRLCWRGKQSLSFRNWQKENTRGRLQRYRP